MGEDEVELGDLLWTGTYFPALVGKAIEIGEDIGRIET